MWRRFALALLHWSFPAALMVVYAVFAVTDLPHALRVNTLEGWSEVAFEALTSLFLGVLAAIWFRNRDHERDRQRF